MDYRTFITDQLNDRATTNSPPLAVTWNFEELPVASRAVTIIVTLVYLKSHPLVTNTSGADFTKTA